MPEPEVQTCENDDVSTKRPEQRVVCKSVKIVDGDDDVDDPNRHLASVPIVKDVRNRVKLYLLCDQRAWDDKGTGHVACIPSAEHQGATFLVVRLEQNDKNILESKILMDTIYQKQQETLIVWSESETCDLALSFQEKSGCDEIWEKICQVQGRDPAQYPDFTGHYDDLDDTDGLDANQAYSAQRDLETDVTLPPCELTSLADFEVLLSNSFGSAALREKLSSAIESQGYVAKLSDLFRMCEDLENMEALHTFHQIAKNLFMLNRNTLLEIMLSEKYFRDIVGMLEYDPSESRPRKHREFLFEKARFREVLPIKSEELRQKIHQTYRVQYVQDVCLPAPSLFEENLLSVLNSYIFFNRVDIVSLLQDDKQLLKDLFDQLKDTSTTPERRKDLTMFLKEFCAFSTSLQPNGPQGREAFYKTLMQNDVLAAVEQCIMSEDLQTRATTVEMFVMIVEFSPQIARDYFFQQGRGLSESKNNQLSLNRLIENMLTDRDPELTSAHAMAQVMRALLDPDNMITVPAVKAERHEFLTFFYKRSMDTLCRPLYLNTVNGVLKRDDYYCANQQALIIDLLCFCFEHHSTHMRTHCVNNKLLNTVLVLLQSKHHFLALSALRLFRRVVQLKDEYYNRHIVRDNVMQPVVECFQRNGHRYNLLNSAIIELFDFIRTENVKPLIVAFAEKYYNSFADVHYVPTFDALKLKYEQMEEREKQQQDGTFSLSEKSVAETPVSAQWRMERQAEADERWFNVDDAENTLPSGNEWDLKRSKEGSPGGVNRASNSESAMLDVTPSSSAASGARGKQEEKCLLSRKIGVEPVLPSLLKRKLEDDSDAIFPGMNTSLKSHITPRIVIKVESNRRSPLSPTLTARKSPPGDPVVSSTETNVSPTSSTPTSTAPPSHANVITVVTKKPLVEYDESDSDEEDENSAVHSEATDSIPSSSSSAGRPSSNSSSQSNSDDQDDVSSTSGDHEPSPVAVSAETEEKQVDGATAPSNLIRKRLSLDEESDADDSSAPETAKKRQRLDDAQSVNTAIKQAEGAS